FSISYNFKISSFEPDSRLFIHKFSINPSSILLQNNLVFEIDSSTERFRPYFYFQGLAPSLRLPKEALPYLQRVKKRRIAEMKRLQELTGIESAKRYPEYISRIDKLIKRTSLQD
ncbi:MAG: hypothetical protein AB8F95_01505, partial [Bacteroidia bacterium]